MKKKIFALLMALALCVTPLLLAVPSFAAADPDDPVYEAFDVVLSFSDGRSDIVVSSSGGSSVRLYVLDDSLVVSYCPVDSVAFVTDTYSVPGLEYITSNDLSFYYPGGEPMIITGALSVKVVSSDLLPETGEPLFFTAFSMLQEYIFGADTVLDEHMQLTLTILATICVLFVVAIPFVVIWLVIRFVVR